MICPPVFISQVILNGFTTYVDIILSWEQEKEKEIYLTKQVFRNNWSTDLMCIMNINLIGQDNLLPISSYDFTLL